MTLVRWIPGRDQPFTKREYFLAPVCHYPCKLLLGICLPYSPQLEVSFSSPCDITIHIFLFLCLGIGLLRCWLLRQSRKRGKWNKKRAVSFDTTFFSLFLSGVRESKLFWCAASSTDRNIQRVLHRGGHDTNRRRTATAVFDQQENNKNFSTLNSNAH